MVFMNTKWMRLLILILTHVHSSHATSTTNQHRSKLRATLTNKRTDTLNIYLSAKRSGKSSPPPQLERIECESINTIRQSITDTLKKLNPEFNSNFDLSKQKFSRLEEVTQFFVQALDHSETTPSVITNGGFDPLRTQNFGFVDRFLQKRYFDIPLSKGEQSSNEQITILYTHIVELCLLMKELIHETLTENNYAHVYNDHSPLFGLEGTKQVLTVAYVCSMSSAMLKWTVEPLRIIKQLLKIDTYYPVQTLLESNSKVACIEYVTLAQELLEIVGIKTTRAATLVGSNPFPGKTNKFNPFAKFFLAHNFLKIKIEGKVFAIEPLRKNFIDNVYCPFPIYDSQERTAGLQAIIPITSYFIIYRTLLPMLLYYFTSNDENNVNPNMISDG